MEKGFFDALSMRERAAAGRVRGEKYTIQL
jgi:hypothetical protein